MKKIVTIIIAVCVVSTAYAQLIMNGGRIIHSFDDDDYFEVPAGANLNLLRGTIKYRDN